MVQPPPGWLTTNEWAHRISRMSWCTRTLLMQAKADGGAECRMYRRKDGGNLKRPTPHWWVNGVSDEIARGVGKNKRGGGITSR